MRCLLGSAGWSWAPVSHSVWGLECCLERNFARKFRGSITLFKNVFNFFEFVTLDFETSHEHGAKGYQPNNLDHLLCEPACAGCNIRTNHKPTQAGLNSKRSSSVLPLHMAANDQRTSRVSALPSRRAFSLCSSLSSDSLFLSCSFASSRSRCACTSTDSLWVRLVRRLFDSCWDWLRDISTACSLRCKEQ